MVSLYTSTTTHKIRRRQRPMTSGAYPYDPSISEAPTVLSNPMLEDHVEISYTGLKGRGGGFAAEGRGRAWRPSVTKVLLTRKCSPVKVQQE